MSIALDGTLSGVRRILVPVDFSAASDRAIKDATRLSELVGADLIFLHVAVPSAPRGTEDLPGLDSVGSNENATARLRQLAQRVRDRCGLAARSVVRCGLPTDEIVQEAKESRIDLIIMASHAYMGWKQFCLENTVERVVRTAPCNVFVVREKKRPIAQEKYENQSTEKSLA